jgi:hypothetical protein
VTNLAKNLTDTTRAHAGRVAVRVDDAAMSYRALDEASARMAGLLYERGLRPVFRRSGRRLRTIAPPWFPAHSRAFAAPYAHGAVVLATHHEDYFPCPRHDVGR